jgi:putative phosphoesterase
MELSLRSRRNPPVAVSSGGAAVIGLISDTHGLLREEALAALKGCDLIIHAGDVGDPEILGRLHAVAPVVAVRGNVDQGAWASELPLTATVEARSALICVLHDIRQLDFDPAAAGFNFVISGHSHKPGRTERAGVIYINPGSAGPRRFKLPVTVARMNLPESARCSSPWSVEFIHLRG